MLKKFGLLLIILVVLWPWNTYAECKIRFRVEHSDPFHYKDADGKWQGIFHDQAEALIKEIGCKIEVADLPWARALTQLKNGDLDMMSWMSHTKERSEFLHFVGPHYVEKMKLVIRDDFKYSINKLEDLFTLPQKIVLVNGAWYGSPLMELLKNKKVKSRIRWVSSGKHLPSVMESIRMNRVSGYVTTESIGMLNTPLYKGLKMHRFIVNRSPLYFGFSKKTIDHDQALRLDTAFKRLKARNVMDNIVKRYE